MKTSELRQLPEAEIKAEIDKRRADVFRLRLRAGSQDVESSGALRRMRRDIARFLTILRERELGLTRASKPASR
jgi:large subunit ribosomal protein L29